MADECCATPTTAFVLSLVGGIIILLSGIMILLIGTIFMSRMMSGYYPWMMGGFPGILGSIAVGIGIAGIICGAIILFGAFMLNANPASHMIWGVVILVFSVISLFEGGGFFVGAVLGIIGGILAITWKPTVSEEAKKSE